MTRPTAARDDAACASQDRPVFTKHFVLYLDFLGISDAAAAQANDGVAIGWPGDVPSWDPNRRFIPDAQAIFKLVFDQPLEQSPKLDLVPNLVVKWELAADGLSMPVELRDDVQFHNGDKLTAEDFRYTFFERIKATRSNRQFLAQGRRHLGGLTH